MTQSIDTVALMYHDVVENRDFSASGLSIPGADLYKLDRDEFTRHLDAIRFAAPGQRVLFTFDDGGASAYDPIAGLLEERGWRGHFFIPTDWIGSRAFLNRDQIRELAGRGHTIGSHSCSHPARFSHIGWDRLLEEWRRSLACLSEIVGHGVEIASVPGGHYSREVGDAAGEAGIRMLFTSEPTAKIHVVNGCRVQGRYAIRRGMGPEWSAGFASHQAGVCLRASFVWKAKQVAKLLGGERYLQVRDAILKS